MQRSTYTALLEKLMQGDAKGYYDILNQQIFSQYGKCCDYDLLLKAINSNEKDLVNRMLDNGCCVNGSQGTSGNHNTPLHLAAAKPGWCDIVEKIIKQGACVYDINEDGNTPLHLAFINQASDKVIQLLLDEFLYKYLQKYPYACDIRNKDGLGIFHIACSRSNEYIVEQLYSKRKFDISAQVSPLSCTTYAGYSPLHFAVMFGNYNVAKFLCRYDSVIYIFTPNGSSPLHLALERRDFMMICVLCINDLRYLDYVNYNGTSHFMAVCTNCDSNWVKMYLRNQYNSLPLMLNARVKDGINYPNAGYTPLHFACLSGRDQIADLLIKFGVHLTLATDNLTPFDIIRIQFNIQIERKVKDIYIEIYDTLQKHCKYCRKCKDLVIENDKRLREFEARVLQETNIQDQMNKLSLAIEKTVE